MDIKGATIDDGLPFEAELLAMNWYYHAQGVLLARRFRAKYGQSKLHRIILKLSGRDPEGWFTLFLDGDIFNCRLANLKLFRPDKRCRHIGTLEDGSWCYIWRDPTTKAVTISPHPDRDAAFAAYAKFRTGLDVPAPLALAAGPRLAHNWKSARLEEDYIVFCYPNYEVVSRLSGGESKQVTASKIQRYKILRSRPVNGTEVVRIGPCIIDAEIAARPHPSTAQLVGEILARFKWSASSYGVRTKTKGKFVLFHRLLLTLLDQNIVGKRVFFLNGDQTDCRMANLRVGTKTGYPDIYRCSGCYIALRGKDHTVHDTLEEAIVVAVEARWGVTLTPPLALEIGAKLLGQPEQVQFTRFPNGTLRVRITEDGITNSYSTDTQAIDRHLLA